jgi:acyl carrier protein
MAELAAAIPSQLDAITAEIISLLQRELGDDRVLLPDQDLQADLALDSLTLMSLTVAIEDRFQVIIKEEEAPPIRTIAELAAYVQSLREKAC